MLKIQLLMRQSLFILLSIFSSIHLYSQNEANIWYFGLNAGVDFNSGVPLVLTDGQLVTDEGCATISDASGQLLFYTDGITVYNNDHQIMANGNGLMGNSSSTQSATVVPRPGSSSIYYVFTTDAELGTNGLRYSVVDMSLDNGNGAVTAEKNILIYTPTLESIGIAKHANDVDYWIVTHGWNSNSFISHQLTSSGLNPTPVITNIGITVTGTGFATAGTIKFAPSGSRLAFASASNFTQFFDFDTSTGVITNDVTLTTESGFHYGAAFSPDESLLYLSTNAGRIYQFNLNVADVPASKLAIYDDVNMPGQLQLGPDNKIYVAIFNRTYLGVINNPNVIGQGCGFQLQGIDLAGKFSRSGLPSFNQSFFFTPTIQLSSVCEGQDSNFTFATNQTVLSATWNFGDGGTSNALNPIHVYNSPGTYTVSVTVTGSNGVGTNTRDITIHPLPVLNANGINLKQCDDDNDGFSAFNLNEVISLLVNEPTGLTFSFHETLQGAKDNSSAINNVTSYTNQTVSNDAVFIRVENANGCYQTAQINLLISTTLIPSTFQKVFTECDDVASGSNIDGIAAFDFSSVTPQIQALYPTGQLLDITYYRNLTDALAENNAITDISNYSNIGYPNTQDIYVRVDSQINNECLGLGHHITLNVEEIPIAQPQIIHHCDDDQDGMYGFDTSTLESTLVNGLTNVSVSYTDENNNPLPSPLPNPFLTTAHTLTATITNLTPKACSFSTTIEFVVDDLPEIFPLPTSLTTVCDDETDPALQDGLFAFDTSAFQDSLLGNQTGMSVNYFDGNGNPLPSPLPNPFVSDTQNITVHIINSSNTACVATSVVPLIVYLIPDVNLLGNELICNDNPNFTKTINAGLIDTTTINDFTYKWFFNGNEISSKTDYSLVVNTEGIYEAEVKNAYGCTTIRTITVTSSNIATIESIEIIDLTDNNTITILVSGLGDYVYSLDNETFQESNTFYNLNAGIYTVYVKDLNQCGTKSKEVSVLGIPKFFTPNGDGYNDFWNIKGFNININSKAIIGIFDRYGKMLKQFNPLNQGWDGTYNGTVMPSTDYWYTVQLEDGRTIKGHFTLKR